MPILDPSLRPGGSSPPSAVYEADALCEVGAGTYRLPYWWDSSGLNGYLYGGLTDNTNPRVNVSIGPWARRVVRFAAAAPYLPQMQTNGIGSTLFSTTGAFAICALYLNTVTTNSGTANANEGIWCSNSTSAGLGLWARNNGGNIILYAGNYAGGAWQFCGVSGLALQTWYTVYIRHTGNMLYLDVISPAGVYFTEGLIASGTTDSLAQRIVMGRNAQAVPSYGDFAIAGFRTWNTALNASLARKLVTYYSETYGNLGDCPEQARDTYARRLFLMADQPKHSTIIQDSDTLALLDLAPGDDIAAQNETDYPTADGKGSGDQSWSRAEVCVRGLTIDADRLKMSVQGLALRGRLAGYIEDNDADLAPSMWRSGPSVLLPGGTRRAFGRPSYKWLEREPDGLVDTVYPDVEAYNRSGLLIEGAARNHCLYSSAFAATGWTYVTDAAHGGSVARTATAGTAYELFAQEVSAYGVKFIHGTGAGKAEQSMTPSAAIATLTANWVFSIDWKGTAAPSYRVTRAADGWYWNDTTGAYQAAAVTNLCAGDLQRNGGYRHQSKPITKAGAGNVTPTIVYPAAIADGAVCWVTHVQCEEWYDPESTAILAASCATSRIPTTTAAVSRIGDKVCISGADYLSTACGTMLILFRPEWNSTDADAVMIRVFHHDFDAVAGQVHNALLYYHPLGIWRFEDFTASDLAGTSAPAARNTWHVLAARWTGAAQELGITSPTRNVFMDGIKGSDSVAGGTAMTTPMQATLYSPAVYNVNLFRACDSYIKHTEIIPRCLSDAEIAAISSSWIAMANAKGW